MRLPSFFNSYFLLGVFCSAFFALLIGSALIFSGLSGDRPLIIHFTAERGIDFFGTRADVLKIVIIGFGVVLINLFLGFILFEKERILSYFLGIASFIFAFLALLALVAVISIN